MSFARQLAGKIRERSLLKSRDARGHIAAQHMGWNSGGAAVAGIMIAPEYLKRIAAWSRELNEREIDFTDAAIISITGPA